MTKGCVLINTAVQELDNVSEALENVQGVLSIYSVTGPYDIIVLIEAESVEKLGKIVTEDIQRIKGIERTLTSIVLNHRG